MEQTRITLRIPKDVAEQVKKEAVNNYRSFNSEIVACLVEKVQAKQRERATNGSGQA